MIGHLVYSMGHTWYDSFIQYGSHMMDSFIQYGSHIIGHLVFITDRARKDILYSVWVTHDRTACTLTDHPNVDKEGVVQTVVACAPPEDNRPLRSA